RLECPAHAACGSRATLQDSEIGSAARTGIPFPRTERPERILRRVHGSRVPQERPLFPARLEEQSVNEWLWTSRIANRDGLLRLRAAVPAIRCRDLAMVA